MSVFEEVRRVLKKDGTLWLVLGDSYNGGGCGGDEKGKWKQSTNVGSLSSVKNIRVEGLKPKDLCMIPARTAIALQRAGWWLRSEIVWHKPNPMPESVQDRPTKSHEMIYLLSKSPKYYYHAEAIAEDSVDPESLTGRRKRNEDEFTKTQTFNSYRKGFSKIKAGTVYEKKNRRSVWTIVAESFDGAHFATFPREIPRLCIAAGSRPGDWVLDPFFGTGTTGEMALRMGRHFIGIEINETYVRQIAQPRVNNVNPFFIDEVTVL